MSDNTETQKNMSTNYMYEKYCKNINTNTDTQSLNVSLTGFCVIQVTAEQYKQRVKFTELLV